MLTSNCFHVTSAKLQPIMNCSSSTLIQCSTLYDGETFMLLFSHVTWLHRLYLLLLPLIWLLWVMTTPLLTVSIWTSTLGGNSHHSTQTSHANIKQNTPFRSYKHSIWKHNRKRTTLSAQMIKKLLVTTQRYPPESQSMWNKFHATNNCSVCKIEETENYHSRQTKMTTAQMPNKPSPHATFPLDFGILAHHVGIWLFVAWIHGLESQKIRSCSKAK